MSKFEVIDEVTVIYVEVIINIGESYRSAHPFADAVIQKTQPNSLCDVCELKGFKFGDQECSFRTV